MSAFLSHEERQQVLYFWAPWCGPCKMSGMALDQFASQCSADVQIDRIHVDECADLVAAFGVTSIPAILILRQGEVCWRWQGAFRASQLHRALEGTKLGTV